MNKSDVSQGQVLSFVFSLLLKTLFFGMEKDMFCECDKMLMLHIKPFKTYEFPLLSSSVVYNVISPSSSCE